MTESIIPTLIACPQCQISKPITEFHKRRNRPKGFRLPCKKCANRAAVAKWKAGKKIKKPPAVSVYNRYTSSEKGKRTLFCYRLKYAYGITIEQYEEMLALQNHQCAICATDFASLERRPCIDHCHETGVVRGLLCGNCNSALGKFKDSPEMLQRAMEYLLKHKA